mmetsp:Transcript_74795/g.231153  ORF Transcript_74795/g.231153 Transcript_74795/m.231153 type:complete len:120 (-) Transcript_74795:162-521(-)|eukprot:CAMPEP_0204593962 /NCGR_PEP_ID=MMETSP0661-20131031/51808_1 /ASSEMBLY_ACC=CAM_ASM_000606 /TAXON_ID=109239 /ORGANISM="Alexandrium margalefi, Strain AMGDE01CS-322" /LENGTH=119 /DNA_ID=CAMNT_0051604315 /DNA_START=86 /DNA_END=445 /DNA_ORIENTATION=-
MGALGKAGMVLLAVALVVRALFRCAQRKRSSKFKATPPAKVFPEKEIPLAGEHSEASAPEQATARTLNFARRSTDEIARAAEAGDASVQDQARLSIGFWSLPDRQTSMVSQVSSLSEAS